LDKSYCSIVDQVHLLYQLLDVTLDASAVEVRVQPPIERRLHISGSEGHSVVEFYILSQTEGEGQAVVAGVTVQTGADMGWERMEFRAW
jgi:hypothetical protein